MLPIFTDDEAARTHLESLLWPDGPACPHCGVVGDANLLKGKSHRPGLYTCRACDRQFTVTIGTVLEDSHIPLHKWMYAIHLMTASKKGISALQLQRMLGLGSYRSAWFLAMRIREAMTTPPGGPPLGGGGKVVEMDETYYGKVENPKTHGRKGRPYRIRGGGPANKRPIVAVIERSGGVRTFHVAHADKVTVNRLIQENIDPETTLYTDESRIYFDAKEHVAAHESVKHSAGEYARGPVHSNNAEAFFGVLKKGMRGIYQHCSEKHLSRYLAEFQFRHNHRVKLGYDDRMRAVEATKGSAGKRLTLRRARILWGEHGAATKNSR